MHIEPQRAFNPASHLGETLLLCFGKMAGQTLLFSSLSIPQVISQALDLRKKKTCSQNVSY